MVEMVILWRSVFFNSSFSFLALPYPLNRMETRITSYTLATHHTLSVTHYIFYCVDPPCSITHRIEYCVHTHQSLTRIHTHTHTHSHTYSIIVHTYPLIVCTLTTRSLKLCAHSPVLSISKLEIGN